LIDYDDRWSINNNEIDFGHETDEDFIDCDDYEKDDKEFVDYDCDVDIFDIANHRPREIINKLSSDAVRYFNENLLTDCLEPPVIFSLSKYSSETKRIDLKKVYKGYI
jgi:hypothetical protein